MNLRSSNDARIREGISLAQVLATVRGEFGIAAAHCSVPVRSQLFRSVAGRTLRLASAEALRACCTERSQMAVLVLFCWGWKTRRGLLRCAAS